MAQIANAEVIEQSVQENEAPSSAVIPFNTVNTKRGYRFVKRTFDIVCSFIALIVLLIPMAIVAICIYIDDPGPVFFLQDRIGFGDKPFRMFKFRSMVANAEDQLKNMTSAQKEEFMRDFKLKNDPRITKIGKFIRKTSIDELPQLINILIGDMSFVGPRPPLLVEREAYGEHLMKVMSVRPGLTGYWQVHGRSETEFGERIEMNEYYIDHRSISLDLKILFATVGVVLSGKGAE